jgi:hypothetical protein
MPRYFVHVIGHDLFVDPDGAEAAIYEDALRQARRIAEILKL